MNRNEEMRSRLATMLEGRGAHITFDAAIEGLPFALVGKKV